MELDRQSIEVMICDVLSKDMALPPNSMEAYCKGHPLGPIGRWELFLDSVTGDGDWIAFPVLIERRLGFELDPGKWEEILTIDDLVEAIIERMTELPDSGKA